MSQKKAIKEEPIDLSKLTPQQLKEALKEVNKRDRENREAKKAQYEKERDELIYSLIEDAIAISKYMQGLKIKSMSSLQAFRDKMLEYGQLRKGEANKGTFEIKTDRYKIQFTNHEIKGFDERATLAEAKLKLFLANTVKKRDLQLHDLILSLISRNHKSGDFDIALINRLYQMEDRFDDANWKEAIKLFKESFVANKTAQYVRFFVRKGEEDQWEAINLDFAKIPANGKATEAPQSEG